MRFSHATEIRSALLQRRCRLVTYKNSFYDYNFNRDYTTRSSLASEIQCVGFSHFLVLCCMRPSHDKIWEKSALIQDRIVRSACELKCLLGVENLDVFGIAIHAGIGGKWKCVRASLWMQVIHQLVRHVQPKWLWIGSGRVAHTVELKTVHSRPSSENEAKTRNRMRENRNELIDLLSDVHRILATDKCIYLVFHFIDEISRCSWPSWLWMRKSESRLGLSINQFTIQSQLQTCLRYELLSRLSFVARLTRLSVSICLHSLSSRSGKNYSANSMNF